MLIGGGHYLLNTIDAYWWWTLFIEHLLWTRQFSRLRVTGSESFNACSSSVQVHKLLSLLAHEGTGGSERLAASVGQLVTDGAGV